MIRFASVILVDRSGRLLLQERDADAPHDPEKWGLVGGDIEGTESDLAAAHRELEEETRVVLTDDPSHVGTFDIDCPIHGRDRCTVFATAVDLTDDDIECHEGRQIVFVDPGRAMSLDLTVSAARVLPEFLASDLYRRLAG
jgi:8-oxo-dGTP pyrophosphatase MutT (NUDIX family)